MRYLSIRSLKVVSILTLMAVEASPATSKAEEGLLWKAINTKPAVVVPAYGGSPSPFPSVEVPVVVVSSTSEMDEKRRLRDEAFLSAQHMVESGNALVPDLRTLVVGGMVQGTLGSRVLIGNQWVAVGTQVYVSQYKSKQALDAIKDLSQYDSEAAAGLAQKLGEELGRHPTLALTLQGITSETLIFKSTRGRQDIKFNSNYN